jgi:hypothetical protein
LELSITFKKQGERRPEMIYFAVARGLEVVEASCGIAPFLAGEMLENVASGIDCFSVRQPLGVS